MSPQAARIDFLRAQHDELNRRANNWPAAWARRHALKKRTLKHAQDVESILRVLAAHLIAGAY